MQGVGLGGRWDRQVLAYRALAGIAHQLPALRPGFTCPAQAGLLLAHRFAGVVLVRDCRGLARISRHLGTGQAQRVLRIRCIKRIEQQLQPPAAQLAPDARVERFTACLAVIAPAIGAEVIGGDVVVQYLAGTLQLCTDAQRVVGTGAEPQPPRVAGLALFAPDLQHATGGIAVERGKRPTQHLDAFGTKQAGM